VTAAFRAVVFCAVPQRYYICLRICVLERGRSGVKRLSCGNNGISTIKSAAFPLAAQHAVGRWAANLALVAILQDNDPPF
jgi:hypothetical protein